ncbi:hypothetical protein N0V90_003308 [Kalmusia sp. IMI 367209]|nr:hypothetical protein N0V90_003308 [Kalmusia sp. IMI 367209]
MPIKRTSTPLLAAMPKRALRLDLRPARAEHQIRRPLTYNEKFAALPRSLLEHIEYLFQNVGVREKGEASGAIFTLNHGQIRLYPKSASTFKIKAHHYKFVDAANTALLTMFMDMEPEFATGDAEHWRALDTGFSIYDLEPNPGLLQLHGLRRGDVGYHFDKHSCLAICFLQEGTGFFSTVDDEVSDERLELELACFFVEAVPGVAGAWIPQAPIPSAKISFILKEKEKEEEGSDGDVVGEKFLAERRREEEEERKREKGDDEDEVEDDDEDVDFVGLKGQNVRGQPQAKQQLPVSKHQYS